MGLEIVEEKWAVFGKCGTSHYNQWGLCGVVILCREGWRSSSSQITSVCLVIISASLSISIVSEALMLRTCRIGHLCVCVRKVYCGKTADGIGMPLGLGW